jgi:hypothetical protein
VKPNVATASRIQSDSGGLTPSQALEEDTEDFGGILRGYVAVLYLRRPFLASKKPSGSKQYISMDVPNFCCFSSAA